LGDEVILIGKQGKEQITADEIADKIGSISYEVLCLIGKRVPRVYKG
jgi:alanine racemase